MIKILIMLLLFITSLLAQNLELDSPKCLSVDRLDAPGRVLSDHPIQNQEDLKTCYANTSSIVFLSKYKQENPNSSLEQISWLSLAQKNKSYHLNVGLQDNSKKISTEIFERGGYIEYVYESIKGKKFCGIPKKEWKDDEFNHSLEVRADIFKELLDEYEVFFQDNETLQTIDIKKQYVSPNCFTDINHYFDVDMKGAIPHLEEADSFKMVRKYLKEPVEKNLKAFKHFYSKHIMSSVLKKGESNALLFLANTAFLSSEKKEVSTDLYSHLIKPEVLDKFKKEMYRITAFISSEQNKILKPYRKKLNAQYVSCIESSLSLDPFNDALSCNQTSSKKTQKLVNFTFKAAEAGFATSFIQSIVSMESPLRTKSQILSNFMQSFYKDCNYKVPTNWKFNPKSKVDLKVESLIFQDRLHSTFFKYVQKAIEKNTAASISVDSNFLRKKVNHKKNPYQHAMAIIGIAKDCSIENEKRNCVLFQNSWGRKEHFASRSFKSTPDHMLPGMSYKTEYRENGSMKKDKVNIYGKFWVCDPDAIEKYITSVTYIK